MKKICVVGSLSYDLVMRVPRRPQKGETIIGNSFHTFVGGKGNNQALAAARCGAPVYIIGKVGKDAFAEQIAGTLTKDGINIDFLYRDPELSTGIADILIDADGDNSISIAPQANGNLKASDIDASRPALEHSSYMLLQLEIPMPTVLHAARLGRSMGLKVVLNPAPAPADGHLPEELLSCLDLIIPNQTEAELLTGIKVTDLMSAVEAGSALKSQGLKQVIITLGEMGALLLEENRAPYMSPAFQVEVLDTTAAGDAFCGALLASLAEGKDSSTAMNYACAAGALATTRLGAEPSLPRASEIEQLLASREANKTRL